MLLKYSLLEILVISCDIILTQNLQTYTKIVAEM